MLPDKNTDALDFSSWNRAVPAACRAEKGWTIILPFFNERHYIERTLVGLASQDCGFHLILIDNGSTDDGEEIARAACARLGLSFTLLREPRPGKVHALRAGLAEVRTAFVATCDADTWAEGEFRIGATARYTGTSVLGTGDYLDLHQGGYMVTGLNGGWKSGKIDLSLTIDNLTNLKGNRFAYGNPYLLSQRDQRVPLRPFNIRAGIGLRW